MRHGESEWNLTDVFAGWVDVPLTQAGRREAIAAGGLLAALGVLPDVVHTSLLRRSISTAALGLDASGRAWVPAHRSWRLNERHYGALQGRSRREVLDEYGEELLTRWRRGCSDAPPPIPDDDPWSQAGDRRYAHGPSAHVRTESLAEARHRLLPYLDHAVACDLRRGRTVLIVSHGNALRLVRQYLENLPDEALPSIEVPTATPIRYRWDAAGALTRQV